MYSDFLAPFLRMLKISSKRLAQNMIAKRGTKVVAVAEKPNASTTKPDIVGPRKFPK